MTATRVLSGKDIAIWTLALALFGAVLEVPGFFLGRVLGSAVLFAVGALVVCAVINARKRKP